MLNRLKIKLQWRGQSLYAAFALALAFTACNSSQISKTAQFEPDSFTTEGKPTKTIETPWGPKEIYDPTQDDEIRAPFKRIYDIDYPILAFSDEPGYHYHNRKKNIENADVSNWRFYAYDFDSSQVDETTQKKLESDIELIYAALHKRRVQYGQLRCLRAVESSCGEWIKFSNKNPSKLKAGDWTVGSQRLSSSCYVDGHKTYSRAYFPVGQTYFYSFGRTFGVTAPDFISTSLPSFEKQLENFFRSECKKWKKRKD